MRRAVPWLAAGALLLGAGAGCGGSGAARGAATTGSFVGTVRGTDAFVAVVAGKENVVAYVCDGAAGLAELFMGARSGSSIDLKTADGSRLTATIGEKTTGGEVRLASGGHRFSASAATGRAGFYRLVVKVRGTDVRVGWVVLGDGRQRGALTKTAVTQAPKLDTASRTTVIPGIGSVSVPLVTSTTVTRAGQLGSGQFSGG